MEIPTLFDNTIIPQDKEESFTVLKYLKDVSEYENIQHDSFPPEPSKFKKEELAKLEGMEWLHEVQTELLYPNTSDIEDQRKLLKEFMELLLSESSRLTHSLIPKVLPPDYDEPILGLDTETTGLDTRIMYDYEGKLIINTELVGLCLATSPHKGYYLPVRHTEDDGILNWEPEVIAEFLSELYARFCIIMHNAQYDREILAINGVTGARPFPYFFDTQTLNYLYDCNEKQNGLKYCSEKKLGRKMIPIEDLFGLTKEEKKGGFINFKRLPATTATVYGCSDAINTFGLFQGFIAHPVDRNVFHSQSDPVAIDHRMIDTLRSLYRCGLPVNIDYMLNVSKDAHLRSILIEKKIYQLAGKEFDIGSGKQLATVLFDESGITPSEGEVLNGNGYFGTSEEVIDKLFEENPDKEILRYIVSYRKINNAVTKIYRQAIVNSYVDAFIPFTRSQIQFMLTNAPTGRLTSSSSKGSAKQVLVNISKTTEKPSFRYSEGTGDMGLNSQGISSTPFYPEIARKIKTIPKEADLNLEKPYSDFIIQELVKHTCRANQKRK